MMKRAMMVSVMVLAARAEATTVTSNMSVSATVSSTCSISAGSLTFGTYNTLTGAQLDGTATLSVACTKGAATTIMLGQGNNAAGGSTDAVPLRRLKDLTTNTLSYTLFTDTNRLLPWGNTLLTGLAYVPSSSASTNITVYGRVTASQDVPAGTYTDTVVATISF